VGDSFFYWIGVGGGMRKSEEERYEKEIVWMRGK